MANGSFAVTTTNQYLSGHVDWSSVMDTNTNSSSVTATMYLSRTNSGYFTGGSGTFTLTINGTQCSNTLSYDIQYNSNTIVVQGTVNNIVHDSEGNKTITISWSGNGSGFFESFTVNNKSGSAILDKIPKVTTIASSIDWEAGTQNLGVNLNVVSSSYIHNLRLQVQHPNGTWTTVATRNDISSATTILFSLDENTSIYQQLAQNNNRPSRLYVDTYNGGTLVGTASKNGTAYAHPSATINFNNFNIGETSVSATLDNNFNPNFKYNLNLTFYSFTKSFTNVAQSTALTFDTTNISSMYAQIPNSTSGNGTVTVTTLFNNVQVGAVTSKSFTAYALGSSANNPTFTINGVTYKDTNTTTKNITGNDQMIVQNKSTVSVVIPSAYKAVANKSATMSSYTITLNGVTKTASYSTSDITVTFGTVNASNNCILTITAIDSRGNNTSQNKTVNIVPYTQPVATTSAERVDGYATSTTLNFDGNISPLLIGGSNLNDIISAKYRYKDIKSSTWSSLSDFPITKDGTNFFGSSFNIDLDNLKAWNVEYQVTDKLGTTTVNKIVGTGQPILFIDSNKKSVGINEFPSGTNTFEVTANTTVTGNLTVSGTLSATSGIGNNTSNLSGSSLSVSNSTTTGSLSVTGTGSSSPFAGGITITGGKDIQLKGTTTGTSSDTGDLVFIDSGGSEVGRLWRDGTGFFVRVNGSTNPSKILVYCEDWGSNSNGSYVRYSDGTQICWMNWYYSSTSGMWHSAVTYSLGGTGFYYQYIASTWTFPASFVGTPSTTSSGDFDGATSETHTAYGASTTSCSLEDGCLNTGGFDTANVALRRHTIAIGRWK